MSSEETGDLPEELKKLQQESFLREMREQGLKDLDALEEALGLRPLQAGEKIEPVKWICKDFLTVGGSALLSGKPKKGKSSLVADIAIAAASGTGAVKSLSGGWLLDFQGKPVRTYYIDTENARGLALRRLDSLSKEKGLELGNLLSSKNLRVNCLEAGIRPPFLNLDKPDLQRDLDIASEWAEKIGRNGAGYEMLVLDVMSHCYQDDEQGRDENNPGFMSNFFRIINAIRKESGAAVLLIHHHRKGTGGGQEQSAGSSQMLRTPETLSSLNTLPEELNPEDKLLFCLETEGRQNEKAGKVYLEGLSTGKNGCRIFREIEEPKKEAKQPGRKPGQRRADALEVLEAVLLKSPETFQKSSFTRTEWTEAAGRAGPKPRSKDTLISYLDGELIQAGKVELISQVSSTRLYKLREES
jgi:hypothetical protein